MKVETQTSNDNTRVMLGFESEFSNEHEYFTAYVWMSPKLCRTVIKKLSYELKKVEKQHAENHK